MYVVNCRASCGNLEHDNPEQNKRKNKISNKFILFWSLATIFLLMASIILPFSIDTDKKIIQTSGLSEKNDQDLQLPPYLQGSTKEELTKEDKKKPIIK